MSTSRRPGTIATRVRKNAKDLTADEWSRFVNALKAIKNRSRPGGVISIYDEFSALHMGAVELHRTWRREHPNVDRNDIGNADPAHDNPGFLPWHRQLLLEFETALQAVDPTVTLPYWDWTDHEFNKKLFSPAMIGGNGGHDHKGGALVDGPFTLDGGWVVNTALHRPAWFVRGDNGTTQVDQETGTFKVQPSLGRSLVRYLGDMEDLATTADVIEFTKRKAMFGPEKLVLRSDLIPVNPDAPPPNSKKTLPRGTLHIGDSFPAEAVPREAWIFDQTSSASKASKKGPVVEKLGDSDRSFREDVQGFRWAVEASPHMHNQTHDWFGYHTTILQDDEISGSSTMPNVACSTADPIFFMHHCNIDRLWAEWQDAGHYGSIFYPKRSDPLKIYADVEAAANDKPLKSYTYPMGHNLDDKMWPWDNNTMHTQQEIQFMLPQFPYALTARDLLDYRSLGYSYDTSMQLAVNNVTPVVVYLPSSKGKLTRQVFPLDIQRTARYLIAAWNKGRDPATISIAVYKKYEEKYEADFIKHGFHGDKVEPTAEATETQPTNLSFDKVWNLPRGSYFVVVTAAVPKSSKPTNASPNPAIDAVYEIGVATSPTDFKLPDIPIAPGVITSPQVPAESAVYLAKHRFAPINLEDGEPQYRFTLIKGAHELFGINVTPSGGFADVKFEGMDALVQLYGPFDLDNDSLPHFDTDGKPTPGDNQTQLSAQLQIASSEGCCERLGSGISCLVTPGRYVLSVFHCSIGSNEERPYKVTYTLNKDAEIPQLALGNMLSGETPRHGRSVNLLYRITATDGKPLVTRLGEIYKFNVWTQSIATQNQVRVAVFTYAAEDLPEKYGGGNTKSASSVGKDDSYVSYRAGYWGNWEVTFEPYHNQILFVRVTILNGHEHTKISSMMERVGRK